MREIKFRVWEENIKQMIYNVGIVNDELYLMLDGVGFDIVGDYREFKLMQFTGLYDKHQKPIYEGDIVEVKSIFSNKNECYVVEYSEYSEWVIGMFLLSKLFQYCEVIGNICENPELIN